MRQIHKVWKNGPPGKATTEIIWYSLDSDGSGDIRLQLEDAERRLSVYPPSREIADQIWFLFRQGSPPAQDSNPFITDLLRLLKSGGVPLSLTPPKETTDG